MSKLWEITDELRAIGDEIADADGVLTQEVEAKLDATSAALDAKVESVALFIRDRELEAEKAKAEKDRLAAIQRAHERTVSGLKDYLLHCLSSAGVDKVETHRARVRRQKAGTPSIDYEGDLDRLPPEYVRVVPESRSVDKKAITQAVRDGKNAPEGCTVRYSEYVRIL